MLRYTFRQLEYFVAVGEAGSIALASEKVNVSSPSISAAINQLEKEFGLPLFVRQHAQGLSLTLAGRRMMVQAKFVLQEANRLIELAGDISGSVRGPLSIGCMVTFAQVVLPSVRRSFETEYPEVRVRQHELNQSEIFSALRRAEIDVALTYDLELPADLQFVSLLELPPYAIVNETHPLAHLPAVSVAELKNHPMVLLDLPFSTDYFLSFFTQIDAKPIIAERTRDMAVMRSLVANGFGYSIANVRPLNDFSPDGKPLKFIPLVGAVRPMRMGLLMSTDAEAASVVRAFVQHCYDRLQSGSFTGLSG
ncbi:LysR family transcriptional regulator [Parasedimentitalea psychrophila]|uniref:LysR family transcriptional regulator n=1 Tax=Parasedimentitalea psychrophila TaxID=2997337 RepID=A0A9Y2KYA1_9RHOB|nr:LysR family transcriptional regulator [Parasedimentitalea psychrophila]WIY24669.1 LysR family transcriptional regulator [Parasedimentitalea psychrophila]